LTVFKGPAVPANQIHDFHSPISPEGLYWVTPVPSSGLALSADGRTATLTMTNVPIIDQPRWPAMEAETTPAFLDFKLVFKSTGEAVKYEDPTRQYRFEGFKAAAQLEASLRVPTIDFTFNTDPMESSSCDFAVMGDEVNGRYYDAAKADDHRAVSVAPGFSRW
jgi:hypothetical protein